MLKLKLITERDVIDSARMYSEYQQNSFLLDKLLTSYIPNIVEFCDMLQHMENYQEIGKMLALGKGKDMNYLYRLVILVNYSNRISTH